MRFYAFVLLNILFLFASSSVFYGEAISSDVEVFFSDECENAVLNEINNAENDILLAIYSFTDRDIARALIKAANRGVDITIKADKDNMMSEYSEYVFKILKTGKISLKLIDMRDYYSMHHKFMVIDMRIVLTGSYNYTVAAGTVNYENLVKIESKTIARKFESEFKNIRSR